MIKKSTWILFILFVVVLGAAVLLEKYPVLPKQQTPTATSSPKLFTDWKSSDVNEIGIKNDGNDLNLTRTTDGTWAFIDNSKKVSQGRVEELITNILGVAVSLTLDNNTPLDAVGLAQSQKVISFKNPNGDQRILRIGNKTPTGDGYYLQLDNGLPFVASQYSIEDILSLAVLNELLEGTPTPVPGAISTLAGPQVPEQMQTPSP